MTRWATLAIGFLAFYSFPVTGPAQAQSGTDGAPGPDGADDRVIEGWLPYRSVFTMVASGRRHVMMGAAQIDRSGNQNISCIGDWALPKAQLLGVRGAPGNTINHPVSYWVPRHTRRVFVEAVDMVSGIGYDRAAGVGELHFSARASAPELPFAARVARIMAAAGG